MPSPEHEAIVAHLRSTTRRGAFSIKDVRAGLELNGRLFPVRDDVDVTPFVIGAIACERYDPPAPRSDGLIVYVHGGAYVAGSLQSHRPMAARIAHATGTTTVAVQYRLAPEHPFPAAIDDVVSVVRSMKRLGTPAHKLVVAGDSAGAGLAVAGLLALVEEGIRPAGAVLLSGWFDLTLSGESLVTAADADPLLDPTSLPGAVAAYAGEAVEDPLVSPALAPLSLLAELPPLLLMAGTADIVVDDSRLLARRAREAGVSVDLDVEPDLIHVWPFLDGVPEAEAAMVRIGEWVRRRWHRS